MQNQNGVIERCFKNAKTFDGSAIKFGKSPKDAAEMLVRRFEKMQKEFVEFNGLADKAGTPSTGKLKTAWSHLSTFIKEPLANS